MVGLGPRAGLGAARRRGAGAAYPPAVVSAGRQAEWDLRTFGGVTGTPRTLIGPSSPTLPTGWSRSATLGIVTYQANAAPLENVDTGGRPVVVRHANAVIRNVRVTNDGTYSSAVGRGILLGAGTDNVSGYLIENVEIDGQGGDGVTAKINGGIEEHPNITAGVGVIRSSYIHHIGGDPLFLYSAGTIVEFCRLTDGGYNPAAHFDGVSLLASKGSGTTIVRNSLIDMTWRPGMYGRTRYVNINAVTGTYPRAPIEITDTVMIGFEVWGSGGASQEAYNPFETKPTSTSDVTLAGCVVARRSSAYAWVYPGGAHFTIGAGNFDFVTGAAI